MSCAVGDTVIGGLPDGLSISAGLMPNASAAASDAGRLAAKEDMIFLRNL